jgi:hypothetical protein
MCVLNKGVAVEPNQKIIPKDEEYYSIHEEELNAMQNVQASFPVFKCMVRSNAMSRHQQSMKHQLNQ